MTRWLSIASSLVALLACGCSGLDHAILDGVTSMPDDSTLTTSGGQLTTGIAAAFQPRVWTHNLWGTHEQSDGIDVQTSNARSGGALSIRFTINVASSGFCTSLSIAILFGFLSL